MFDPPIGSNCDQVLTSSQLYLVTWDCSEQRCSSCEGAATYAGTGGLQERCFREYSRTEALELTYAACSATASVACVWQASFVNRTELNFGNTECTTSNQDENGTPLLQGLPTSGVENQLTSSAAPYEYNTCYSATLTNNAGTNYFRSYKFFCSTLPQEFQGLNVTQQIDLRPAAPPTVQLLFSPQIAPECTTVANGRDSPTYLLFWLGDSTKGSCGGQPSFIATAGDFNCFQAAFPQLSFLVTSTYLACNVGKTKAW